MNTLPHELANHLWQSTLFSALAAVLVFAVLPKAGARIRHAVWLAASLKFLLPLALLSTLTARLVPDKWQASTPAVITAAAQEFAEPFSPLPEPKTLQPPVTSSRKPYVFAAAIWLFGTCLVLGAWFTNWRNARRRIRAATPTGYRLQGVEVRKTDEAVEPAVYGILKPVLLLPEHVFKQLDEAQRSAILAHELCHVRRADNFTGALHMLVQSLFWFHPLVWWIGARLIIERERACDESVLEQGASARAYAEGILQVCRLTLQAPAMCASGVSSSGEALKQRLLGILAGPAGPLSRARKAVLALAIATVVVTPFLLTAQQSSGEPQVLRFEVASIKPSKAGNDNSRLGPGPQGGLRAENVTLMQLLTFAYDVRDFQVEGAPSWVNNDRYDLIAKPENYDGPGDIRTMSEKQRDQYMLQNRLRLQTLLKERFQLAFHRGQKEHSVYILTVAKGGPKLKVNTSSEFKTNPHMRATRGSVEAVRIDMPAVAQSLSRNLRRVVIDKTGLTERYDFKLEWSPETSVSPDAPADTQTGPTLFTALQEQLGLKLESGKAPVDLLVIDKVERPSAN